MKSFFRNEYVRLLIHPKMLVGYTIIVFGVIGWAINALFGLSEADSLLSSLAIIITCFLIFVSKTINHNESESKNE